MGATKRRHFQQGQSGLETVESVKSQCQIQRSLLTKLYKSLLDPLGGALGSVSYRCSSSRGSRDFPRGVSLIRELSDSTVRDGARKNANACNVFSGLRSSQFGRGQ